MVGLDPKDPNDSWAAWCFDEACFMWGRYIESQIHDATRGSKNDKQANTKAQMMMRRIMSPLAEPEPEGSEKKEAESQPPAPVPKGKFRDPAAMMKG